MTTSSPPPSTRRFAEPPPCPASREIRAVVSDAADILPVGPGRDLAVPDRTGWLIPATQRHGWLFVADEGPTWTVWAVEVRRWPSRLSGWLEWLDPAGIAFRAADRVPLVTGPAGTLANLTRLGESLRPYLTRPERGPVADDLADLFG